MALETTTLFTTRNVFAAFAVASVLLLGTACAPEAGAGGESTSRDSNIKPSGEPSKGSDAKAGPLTGTECLSGEWLLDNEKTAAVFQNLTGGLVDNVKGDVTLILRADGTTTTDYNHWTHSVTIAGGSSTVERHGIDQGTWSATGDGNISMKDNEVGSITTVTVDAGGQSMTQTITPEATIFALGDFTCSADTLIITVEGQSAILNRTR